MGVTESKTRNLLAAFILLKHLSGATITIDKSLAEVKTGDTLMINCTVSELSEDVIFKRNGNEIGRCGAPVPIPVNLCPDGFNQDQSTNITTYNVMSANASSDEGTWTCEHSPESSAALPIIVYGFPTSPVNDNQAYLPNSVDATNMDDIQLYVNISECVNPAPTFKWTFYKNCDGTTITSSNLITSTNSKDLDIACSPPYSAYKSTIKVTDMRKVVGNDDYCYNVRCVVEYPETSFSQISVPFLTNITFTGPTTTTVKMSTGSSYGQTTDDVYPFTFLHDNVNISTYTTSVTEGDSGDKHLFLITIVLTLSLCGTICLVSIIIILRIVYRASQQSALEEATKLSSGLHNNSNDHENNTESYKSQTHYLKEEKMTKSEAYGEINRSKYKDTQMYQGHTPLADNIHPNVLAHNGSDNWHGQRTPSSKTLGQEEDLHGYIFYRG